MEITGFTDKNIQQYVKQFFDQMKDDLADASYTSDTLFKHIKSNTRLWGVAHIPLMLELICTVWSNKDWSKTRNLTTTELYTTMVQWICRRYLKAQNINIQTMSKNRLYQRCQKELTFLSILAFKAIKRNQIILSPKIIELTFEETDIDSEDQARVLNIGILKSFNKYGTGTQIEMDKDHYFIHLSFQEYFAALYLVNQLKGSSITDAVEFIKYQKYNQRYALMFTFIAGLLHENQTNPTSDIFWEAILKQAIDLVGVRHAQLIISCLEATYDPVHTHRQTDLLKRIAQIIQNNLRPDNAIINNHLSQSLGTAQSVMSDDIVANVLINLLQNDDHRIKMLGLSFIAKTSVSNIPSKLLTSLANCIDDKHYNVRSGAFDTLGRIGEKSATKELIDKLVSALTDENEKLRQGACFALGNIGEKAATKEVIDKLVSVLTHENEGVRESALDALENIGEKAATKEVIEKIFNLFWNRNMPNFMDMNRFLTKVIKTSIIAEVDPEVLVNYYSVEVDEDILLNISIEQLLNIWLRAQNCYWLQITVHALLFRGGAVILRDEKVVVFETKEAIEISVPDQNLREQLQKALFDQRQQFFSSLEI